MSEVTYGLDSAQATGNSTQHNGPTHVHHNSSHHDDSRTNTGSALSQFYLNLHMSPSEGFALPKKNLSPIQTTNTDSSTPPATSVALPRSSSSTTLSVQHGFNARSLHSLSDNRFRSISPSNKQPLEHSNRPNALSSSYKRRKVLYISVTIFAFLALAIGLPIGLLWQ